MSDPYRMILVNIAALTLLGFGTFFYTQIYPKKKLHPFVLLILCSVLPLMSILRYGVYESGDFNFNIYKSMSLFNAIQDGQILPRWAGDLNATFGYPLFNFTYPLPYYIILFFHMFGFSFIASLKITLIAAYVFSGIAMYLFTKSFLNKPASFVSAIFYLFAPYHLVDLHFRVAIGELFSFIFLPCVFLGIHKLQGTKKLRWYLFTAITETLLLLSHQAIALGSFPIIVSYILFYGHLKKLNIREHVFLLSSLVIGFLLAAFYVLPVLFESQFTIQPQDANISFPNFFLFIFSPWRHGFLFQGPKGELSFIIGYAQLFVVFSSGILLLKSKRYEDKKKLAFFLAWFFLIFFLMQSVSKPIWDAFPLLKNFQFSYRFLVIIAFLTSVLAGIVINKFRNQGFILLLLTVTILSTVLNWGNRRVIPSITDEALRNNIPYATFEGEGLSPAMPKWVKEKRWIKKIPSAHLEKISGDGEITEITRKSQYHEYVVNALSDMILRENTWYFPGWKIFANNKEVLLTDKNVNDNGTMQFPLKKGFYSIKVIFSNTKIRTIGEFISLLTVLLLVFFGGCSFLLKNAGNRKKLTALLPQF